MRRNIVAGNWKMNTSLSEGKDLIKAITEQRTDKSSLMIVCPPFTHLGIVAESLKGNANVKLGAQNVNPNSSGAYTGEIAVDMLKEIGVEFIIIGHSERRDYFGENNEFIKEKVDQILSNDVTPIFCCGESLETREEGKHFDWIKQQVSESLFHLSKDNFEKVVIAYEPIWAIGTGVTASTEQAQEIHAFIRQLISDKYGDETANNVSILYGGSCKPGNAKELFANQDVDGGLIGGASLKAEDFIAISESF